MQFFVYQKTLIYDIYPRLMTKVNVSATVRMSATVGECPQQWGNVRNSGGNVRNSGEIQYAVRNSRLEKVINNFA